MLRNVRWKIWIVRAGKARRRLAWNKQNSPLKFFSKQLKEMIRSEHENTIHVLILMNHYRFTKQKFILLIVICLMTIPILVKRLLERERYWNRRQFYSCWRSGRWKFGSLVGRYLPQYGRFKSKFESCWSLADLCRSVDKNASGTANTYCIVPM